MLCSPKIRKISEAFPAVDNSTVLAGQRAFKYADFFYAKNLSCDYVKMIASEMEKHVLGEHKYVLLDVKVCEIKAGKIPAYGFWHTDCTLDMRHKEKEEHHVIFVSGAGSRTEFISSDIDVDFSGVDLKRWSPEYESRITKAISDQSAKILKIDERTLYSYGRDIHRATPALFDETRILVRMTETNIVYPKSK